MKKPNYSNAILLALLNCVFWGGVIIGMVGIFISSLNMMFGSIPLCFGSLLIKLILFGWVKR